MSTKVIDGQVSIVMAAYNALEYSRLCLYSIFKYTPLPFELILVNNGSSDGTKEFFESVPGAHVIHNKDNLGFAKGYNQGLKASSGSHIIIINNDCIVGHNWLNNMLLCSQSQPDIGLVGPRGNNINGCQRMERSFANLANFFSFTSTFNKHDPEKWFEVSKLVGFCLLIKREALNSIGYFDERYGIGTHEDIDYSIRARQAGWKLFCAGDVFIYHFSHRTFYANQLDLQSIYKQNKAFFQQKWSIYGRNTVE
ncbi:MAG: glycosyltransferase family 2 protein [Firmicutes bacterium]|nr:glycosyltransferase family 2 protein [Bacillota bacterium]